MSRRTLYTPVLQDESLQVIMQTTGGLFNLHRVLLSLHRGPPINVPIQWTAHLFSVIPTNDTKESTFGHQNFSLPATGIEPMTSSTKGQCAEH